jgi:hypothetical protein
MLTAAAASSHAKFTHRAYAFVDLLATEAQVFMLSLQSLRANGLNSIARGFPNTYRLFGKLAHTAPKDSK